MRDHAQDVRRGAENERSAPREPAGRHQTFDSLVRIKTSSDGDPTDPEVPVAKRQLRASKRRSELLTTAVAVALLLLGLVLVFATGRQVSRQQPEGATSRAASRASPGP